MCENEDVAHLRLDGYRNVYVRKRTLDLKIGNSALHLRVQLHMCIQGKAKWNYDFEPGPFPQEMTEKQRKVLAEKYNLEPEDYKPIDPKLGLWTGDFPDVPYLGHGTRSPWEDWDQPEARRNYMEPCRYNYDYFRRFDPGYEYKTNVSHKTAVGVLILIPSVLFALHFYTKDVSIRPALKPTQFPYNYKDIKLGNVEGVKQNVHGDFHVESPHH
ncbi:hypothetical protein FSP39_015656 [Pinctada imbricata]|uniref:NADH dehydrogenase [ubiquinone] 1 beta subcomplex subunit 8, mitochondrial n=1 Tax=Pinctada imbricata TaxID=66713 RepID=A0AA88Y4U2_PINIB|nr:hypothetical protein FSP39_015656 [Pinctada imbricata]